MNKIIFTRGAIFSLIFGATLGLIASIPIFIGYVLFILLVFSSVIVILFMKKNDKHLGIIDTQDGAILGALIGFLTTVGFFVSFTPMMYILRMIFKNYYTYAIPDAISMGMWLFVLIIVMSAFMFAITNAASGMMIAWLLTYFEKKPREFDEQLDIKIED